MNWEKQCPVSSYKNPFNLVQVTEHAWFFASCVPTASMNLNAAQVWRKDWNKRKLDDLVKSLTWMKPSAHNKVSNIFMYYVGICSCYLGSLGVLH